VIEPVLVSFEDKLLFGVVAILPGYCRENDPRIAVGNQAKIANDHRVSFRLDNVQQMPGRAFAIVSRRTLPHHLRLIHGASKERHSAARRQKNVIPFRRQRFVSRTLGQGDAFQLYLPIGDLSTSGGSDLLRSTTASVFPEPEIYDLLIPLTREFAC
jgi:hypothetical protein